MRTILQVELHEFRTCLGDDFYDVLKEDEVDYSAAVAYTSKEYAEGELAIYEGWIYKALEATSTLPSDTSKWVLAPKFTTSCYESLWCLFLGEYLSLNVVMNRLPFLRAQISGKGINTNYTDHSNPASDKSYETLQKAIAQNIAMTFENMDKWMRDHDANEENTDCFQLYKGIADESCSNGCSTSCNCGSNCLTNKKKKTRMRVA